MFDTHAHYDDRKFEKDREDIIYTAHNSGVNYILNVSVDMSSANRSIELANKYNFMYAAIGIHPHEVCKAQKPDIERLYHLAQSNSKVVAIGEIGLDYHYNYSPKQQQIKWFSEQIELAKRINLPIIVHNREAHNDTLEIIKNHGARDCGGVFHCYSGSREMLRTIMNNNMYVSVGGPITFKNARKLVDVVKFIPLDRLLVETDCPYLAPEPFRGKRNDSSLLKFIIEKIAEIRGVSIEKAIELTTENARTLFGIK